MVQVAGQNPARANRQTDKADRLAQTDGSLPRLGRARLLHATDLLSGSLVLYVSRERGQTPQKMPGFTGFD